MARAAMYVRSSKDRSDVSIDAQRRELTALAKTRGDELVAEYSDVVESAKTANRPGFQQLVAALKAPDRRWTVLLLLDTSRLARRTYIAHVFKYECQKRGVEVVYAKHPDTDPITRVVIENVFQAFDEVHSLMSREKGLAGMRENVHRGYRAGGRAPWGYRLERIATGVMRDGEQVMKSKLVPSDEAPIVKRYLRMRASGTPRAQVIRDLGIKKSASTLICVEWNAQTYAGNTVWNVHAERTEHGYIGGHKRRPKEEWVIQRETHPAMISDREAEVILSRLESSEIGRAVSQARAGIGQYLLSGLLVSPDGRYWSGHRGDKYRVKRADGFPGRTVPRSDLDQAVLGQITTDMQSSSFAKELLRLAKERNKPSDESRQLQDRVKELTQKINKAVDMALAVEDAGPFLRRVDQLESERKATEDELQRMKQDSATAAALDSVTAAQVSKILRERLQELEQGDRVRSVLSALVDKVVLDPSSLDCRIHYRVTDRWQSMASPRVSDWLPLLAGQRDLRWIAT